MAHRPLFCCQGIVVVFCSVFACFQPKNDILLKIRDVELLGILPTRPYYWKSQYLCTFRLVLEIHISYARFFGIHISKARLYLNFAVENLRCGKRRCDQFIFTTTFVITSSKKVFSFLKLLNAVKSIWEASSQNNLKTKRTMFLLL